MILIARPFGRAILSIEKGIRLPLMRELAKIFDF